MRRNTAVFTLVYTSPGQLSCGEEYSCLHLGIHITWPAQLWGGIQLSSPWYTHYLGSSVLGIHLTWPAQFLVYTLPGQLSSWYTPYLASSVLDIHITWPAQFLVYTLPGQLSSWYTHYLGQLSCGKDYSCLHKLPAALGVLVTHAACLAPRWTERSAVQAVSLGLLGHLGRLEKESSQSSSVSLPNLSVSLLSRRPRSQHKVQEAPEWQAVVGKLDQCRARSHR